MTMLLVQIFLLMLAAFLAGAAAACLFRRTFSGSVAAGPPGPLPGGSGPSGGGAHTEHAARFERALTGGHATMVPPPFQRNGAPVVEVQPSVPPILRAPAPPEPQVAKPPKPPERVAMPAPPPAPEPPPAPVVPAAPAARETAQQASRLAATVAAAVAAGEAAAAPAAKQLGDDLTRIRSIDAELQRRLAGIGVRRFRDIAGWTEAQSAQVDQVLGLEGRVEQENWIEQAQILARGGEVPAALGKPSSEPAQAVPVSTGADRLHRIVGVDGATEQLLIANGVTRFKDIAGWGAADIERVEALLGKPGRVGLENWVEQAQILARRANGVDSGDAPEHAPDGASRFGTPTAPATTPAPQAVRPRRPVEFQGLRSVRSEALLGSVAPAVGALDDLKRIRGVGILIEKKLNSLGVTSYEQIANWTGADIDRVSQLLDFKGRIERENWIEQARILASGGATDFSRRVDRGEVESSRNTRA